MEPYISNLRNLTNDNLRCSDCDGVYLGNSIGVYRIRSVTGELLSFRDCISGTVCAVYEQLT